MEKLGCQHYERKCEILAPCCQIWYNCRLCHNDKYQGPKKPGCQVETMDRRAVERIRCLLCKEEQPVSNECQNCKVQFARYYCPTCKFWDDSPTKRLYHCDKCGICRVAAVEEEYFHCDVCVGDFPESGRETHKCTKEGSNTNCPICFENLFTSREPSHRLSICGHFIHSSCLQSYLESAGVNRCPLCSKDIFKEREEHIKRLDQMLEATAKELPPEVKDKKVTVLCHNCEKKSFDVPFHFLGLKCQQCGSYNTRQI